MKTDTSEKALETLIMRHVAIKSRTHPLTYRPAIARTELEIALMQEYRTRLTADIVTGKLDVREAAAKLPEGWEGEAQAARLEEMDENGFDAGE